MRIDVVAFILILGTALGGQAAPAAPSGICLRQDMVQGWSVLNDSTLIVTDRVGKKFRLSLAGACHDLQFLTALRFRTFSGSGLSCLTRHDAVDAALPGVSGPPQRCLITDVQEYTAAMENADEMAEGTLHHHPDTHGEIGAIP
ncbi:MAG: DUF6491 family protein [Pseudomonadota bacterium]